jgi:putative ubiquitin-RnfH superfamily antitoxin RatB of RatAB toxin-antitoxin module
MFISVEVVFAENQQQKIVKLYVPPTSCVAEIIRRSGILSDFPHIDLTKNKVGIFGKLRTLDSQVEHGDRIEIYRPLIVDPKKIRRNRAKRQNVY